MMVPDPAFLTLQERVRIFNLGTPTPMHVGTHELVNDLWRANADMLAALKNIAMQNKTDEIEEDSGDIEHGYDAIIEIAREAIAKVRSGEQPQGSDR